MSIVDKLTYLNTTKQLLKTEINKINNVLDDNSTFRSYPEELFNGYLDVLNNGTDTLWNNLEKVSQTGTEAVLEGVETAPMKMVLNGNTSQDGEPTPDTPVEVKVVKGENVVSVSGKNLFDTDSTDTNISGCSKNVSDNKIILTSTTSTTGYCGFRIRNVKPNTSYTLRYNAVADYFAGYQIRSYDESDAGTTIIGTTNSTNANRTFTTPNDCSYISIFLYSSNNKEVTIGQKTTYSNIQLEEGSTATEYEPYSKTDYPINLGDIELCKINTYKDYFHKDNGKWYVHKEIGKVVLNGSENWNTYQGTGVIIFRTIVASAKSSKSGYLFSNYFKQSNILQSYGLIRNQPQNYYNLEFTIENITEVADFKTWLSSHNTQIYSVLATPTEEEITNTTLIEQLEAIANAKSVKDKTYITQTNDELPFILDVEAIKEYEVV